MNEVITIENTEMQIRGEVMDKYELLASVLNAENAYKASEILKECQEYRDDDTFNTLYCAVATHVADWKLHTKKGGEEQ